MKAQRGRLPGILIVLALIAVALLTARHYMQPKATSSIVPVETEQGIVVNFENTPDRGWVLESIPYQDTANWQSKSPNFILVNMQLMDDSIVPVYMFSSELSEAFVSVDETGVENLEDIRLLSVRAGGESIALTFEWTP